MGFALPLIAGASAIGTGGLSAGALGLASEGGLFSAGAFSGGSTLAALGTAATAASSVVGALGNIRSGEASSAAAKFNAGIAENNASIEKQNAAFAGAEGEENAAVEEQKTRAQVGAIQANQGASGIAVDSGSALDVRSSASSLGELNAINIRANAARQAYGYNTEAVNSTSQAALDKSEASNDTTSGFINAGSTILGGAGKTVTGYQEYLKSGGLNG